MVLLTFAVILSILTFRLSVLTNCNFMSNAKELSPIVRVGPRGQITIPNALRERTKVSPGSFLSAAVHRNLIILKPLKVVELVSAQETAAAIAEGLADYRAGRVSGPYKNMAEFKAKRRQRKI